MALTFEELESVTNDYFMLENGKAVDIYFNTSFLLNYLMKQQKGIWERPDGGMKIRIPLEYDGQEAEFYSRGDTISSDDRESVNAAFFEWKHAYGNATVYRIDTLKNAGEYAEVQLVSQRVSGAQKSLTKLLASSIYDGFSGASERLTGVRACCNETSTQKYGDIAEDDLVAAELDALLVKRTEARLARDFAEADRIRDQLTDMGIVIEDGPDGPRWRRIGN